MAYHPGLEQLILNSRNWNEFYILDHGISSEEAAGPAGDLLYRWGNPQAYGRGTEADRQLFQQHDPHWILEDGPAALGGDPEVTVLLYNNGNGCPGGNASTVDELTLPGMQSQRVMSFPGRHPLCPGGTRLELAGKPHARLPQPQHQRCPTHAQRQHPHLRGQSGPPL